MSAPTIGIDFGTTTSSMAWVDPRSGEAKIIRNAEGEEKTPSVVWFGDGQTLVGSPAEQMLEDEDERHRVVLSVKRELVNAPTLALPGRRVKAVEVAAELLKKLKRDAEELHFHEPVVRAVVTCPAAFGPLERDEIARAARLAGFADVTTVEEPVAAALAYSREGLGIGRHVLVYDLGGGTFDLALLREEAGSYELALEPKGLLRCGGDDFDAALYDWCEEEAERQWGEPLNAAVRDLRLLRYCRQRKEGLSARDQVPFSSLVGKGRLFKHTLTRDLLEGLIGTRVDATVRLTGDLVRTAKGHGCEIETVVLIGGSSRIPMIQRKLLEALPVEPQKWQHQDVAVALGAAYFAQSNQPRPVPVPAPTPVSDPAPGPIPKPVPEPPSTAVLALAPDGTGDCATFEQAVAVIPMNGTIRLLPGEYRIKAPLKIDKPLRILGAGMDATTIVGYWEEYVIAFAADGAFAAEGITFRHDGTTAADVLVVTRGEVDITSCRFTGGALDGERYGNGLVVSGEVTGRVKKCRAEKNADTGCMMRDQTQLTLDENVCEANQAGILYVGSAGGVARKNRCADNERFGIAVSEQAQPTLEENVCKGNKEAGIIYVASAGGKANGNRCVNNDGFGLEIVEQAQPTLEENLCEGNKMAGIFYSQDGTGVARRNRCLRNELPGIQVVGQAQPILEGNVCEGNNSAGILYGETAGGVARNNRCIGNEWSGIEPRDQAKPTLEGNICETNKQAGICYQQNADGQAGNNRCVGNEWSGIQVQDQAQPVLEENVCEGNQQAGIFYCGTAGGVARKNRCAGNELSGIMPKEQARPTLEQNICEGNKGPGIAYLESAGGQSRNNQCRGNESDGILVAEEAQPTLEANVCENNKELGICYRVNAGGMARKNRCIGNTLSGLAVIEQAQPTLEGNVCELNRQSGILFSGSAGGVARRNRCATNHGDGMTLQGQAIPTLEDNTCESNQQAGLLWLGSAAGMARRNRCAGNGAVGIQLQEQALPTLESNVCEGNQQGSIDCFGLTQFSALMASKSLGATKIDVALTTILTDCVPQADLFVRASIPAHKLANARVTCNVPAGEVILGLIDCTVFGSAKDALLFGAQGIYYRNIMVSTATTAIVGKLLYREFPNCQFKLDEKEIVLTPQKRCSLSGSEVPVLKACQILIAIRQFVMVKLQSGSSL